MTDKDSIVSLREVMTQAPAVVKEYINIILAEDIPVLCVNRGMRKKRTMPFKALYDHNNLFWRQDGSWEYFLAKEDLAKVKEKAVSRPGIWETETIVPGGDERSEKQAAEQGYGTELKAINAMTDAEKIQKVDEHNNRLNDLLGRDDVEPEVVTQTLIDSTRDAALINHNVLLEAMRLGDHEARKITQNLVNSTREMVKTSTQLISEDLFNDKLMNTLVKKSNGMTVQHMIRVYLNGIAFLAFYNRLVTQSSAINKLRISFSGRYSKFYHALLPHIPVDVIQMENVFYKGMRAIPPDFFCNWAVGFLIHDVGKASAVEYHEGESAYNRDIVVEHVKIGYNSVMNKTNYPREAALITGYHHEYYGDSSGYGYFRSYLEQYKKINPSARQDYCIAYELEPMLDYQALAYFPAKVLEIIDVFDSVTDPNRIYRKAMTPDDALAMMREEFIVKHRKLDPVLFDIFTAFVREKQKKGQLKGKS
ncbi:MAG: metal-dependent phosphohydrolase [Treponema sp.]|nr:metal-dependent phosphohydrolase [Treponema sp.]